MKKLTIDKQAVKNIPLPVKICFYIILSAFPISFLSILFSPHKKEAIPPAAVQQPTIKAVEGAPKLDLKVEPANKEAAFSYQFQENLDPFAGQLAFEMGKKILIANNNDDKLFAKNTCELIANNNGDPEAAAAYWAEVNGAIDLEEAAKEIVYQWQFDAARETKVCSK